MKTELSAAAFLPNGRTLSELRSAASGCQGCPLWRNATQTVFGSGKQSAEFLFVGEQPGDKEDIAGKPFVGPAGRVLDQALGLAGIQREAVYITNAVKHFKWTPKGKRRIHQKPSAREIAACRPWLEAEIEAIKPRAIVCLGTTAAHAVFGRPTKILANRGKPLASDICPHVFVTVHPSALLRIQEPDQREHAMNEFVADLAKVLC
jgi:uracil-DNA glycosylase family protein